MIVAAPETLDCRTIKNVDVLNEREAALTRILDDDGQMTS